MDEGLSKVSEEASQTDLQRRRGGVAEAVHPNEELEIKERSQELNEKAIVEEVITSGVAV